MAKRSNLVLLLGAPLAALSAALLLSLSVLPAAEAAQQLPWQASTGDASAPAVRYQYPEQVSAEAAKPTVVELHFRIRDGLHINSHEPREKSLIRTELIVAEPPGVSVSAVDFPPGADYALKAFPNQKLSVYTGELVLRVHLTATRGDHLVQAALRYQACDTDSCYPPKKAPVALDVVAR